MGVAQWPTMGMANRHQYSLTVCSIFVGVVILKMYFNFKLFCYGKLVIVSLICHVQFCILCSCVSVTWGTPLLYLNNAGALNLHLVPCAKYCCYASDRKYRGREENQQIESGESEVWSSREHSAIREVGMSGVVVQMEAYAIMWFICLHRFRQTNL